MGMDCNVAEHFKGHLHFNKQKLMLQGSHSTWETWKNESTPGKPGNIMEF